VKTLEFENLGEKSLVQPLTIRKSDYLLMLLHKLNVFKTIRSYSRNYLTVLNYHRIDNPFVDGFDTFLPNISATPENFAAQMDHVAKNYNVISGNDIAAFLRGEKSLPPYAAVITFDDGYLDNYVHAYPVLKSKGLPAIIFLATDYIGTDKPFYWDLVAYCFQHTQKDSVELPRIGRRSWMDFSTREKIMQEWIDVLKTIPETEKQDLVNGLPDLLDVVVPDNYFKNLTISWSQAFEMSKNGIEMGGHTESHPILTRISLDNVRMELSRAKQVIESEIKQPVVSFAYPNGQITDFNSAITECVQQAGYKVAFTLLSGPTRYKTVAKHPLTIRRIFLSYEDNFSRFIAKLVGVPRVVSRW